MRGLSAVELIHERVLSACPDHASAKDYLTSLLESRLVQTSLAKRMGPVRLLGASDATTLSSAIETAARIDSLERVMDRPEGIVDLGNIFWILRPLFRVRDGLISDELQSPWHHLKTNCVEKIQNRCCKIRFRYGNNIFRKIGSGFVVSIDALGSHIALTNKHVLEQASALGFQSDKDAGLTACFLDEENLQGYSASEYDLEVLAIHEHLDVAAVRLLERDGLKVPSIFAEDKVDFGPEAFEGQEIGVVGFPTIDTSVDRIYFPKSSVLVDGSKIFSPGKVVNPSSKKAWLSGRYETLLHDATTFSGSSGSCIVDLDSQAVLGIHFGGWMASSNSQFIKNSEHQRLQFFEANGAISWSTIFSDDVFQKKIETQ